MSQQKNNPRGAQLGNGNAVRSGIYSFLATGSYPRGAGYVRRLVGQFRSSLEEVALVRDGEVSLYHGAVIQSACRHEGRAQLLQRWLRELDNGESSPSISDRLSLLKEIGNATDARDRCLKSLGLHLKPEDDDAWPTIDAANVSATCDAAENTEGALKLATSPAEPNDR